MTIRASVPSTSVFFALGLSCLTVVSVAGCGSNNSSTPASGSGGSSVTASGGKPGSGGVVGSGGSAAGGSPSTGGKSGSGGASSAGGATGAGDAAPVDAPGGGEQYVVALVQASKENAKDLTMDDVRALVSDAISKAGGLDFIKDGQTVVLKPNLVTAYKDGMFTAADATVNGIATDWRVTKAVADLVRAKNPKGKILVMEGSTMPATTAFSILGYTSANFGTSVDEFVGIEGSSCSDTTGVVQRTAVSGKAYWVNSRFVNADVVISLPTMKTHLVAGITGGVKNLGIGATPAGPYSDRDGGMVSDCTRGQTAAYIDHSGPEPLGAFIRDFYSTRPADFVVMDALQGLEHGPLPAWDSSGQYDYEASKKNMRLILAGRNAVAVDTIEALVMKCDPKKVPHLTKLEADGVGTTDPARISVVGRQVSDVAKPFAGKQTDICPGT